MEKKRTMGKDANTVSWRKTENERRDLLLLRFFSWRNDTQTLLEFGWCYYDRKGEENEEID